MSCFNRFLFATAIALLSVELHAQTGRTVLVEQFTSALCPYCPEGSDTIAAILGRTPNAVVISYHSADSMAAMVGEAIMDSLHRTGYPQAAFDRVVWQISSGPPVFDIALSPYQYGVAASLRAQETSPLEISLSGSLDTVTRALSGTVAMNVRQAMIGAYSLHIAITEDSVNHSQMKLMQVIYPYMHMHVARDVITGVNGVPLTTTGFIAYQQIFHNFNCTVAANVNLRNARVTAFVDQVLPVEYGHRNVQQAVQERLWGNPSVITLLPVELEVFIAEAADGGVLLRWSTSSETNNSGWHVERSTHREPWRAIGFVAGAGTSSQRRDYRFFDETATAGREHNYRLRQIDCDGGEKFSHIATIKRAGFPATARLHQNHPNPFTETTSFKVELEREQRIRVYVFDALGRLVQQAAKGIYPRGMHSFAFRAINTAGERLPSGVYLYSLVTDKGTATRRMVLK